MNQERLKTEVNNIRNEALASDFEYQNLKVENERLKNSQLSESFNSGRNTVETRNVSTLTEQFGQPMFTIPMPEKKKEVKFDTQIKPSVSQGMKEKLSKSG